MICTQLVYLFVLNRHSRSAFLCFKQKNFWKESDFMQLAELIGGKKDVVTEVQVATKQMNFLQKRLKAEIVLRDGTRRYFKCKSIKKDKALLEVLLFVDCLQKEMGESIVWRFTDEKQFYLGSKMPDRPSKIAKAKKWLLDNFFLLED